jgi:hypothetical protein
MLRTLHLFTEYVNFTKTEKRIMLAFLISYVVNLSYMIQYQCSKLPSAWRDACRYSIIFAITLTLNWNFSDTSSLLGASIGYLGQKDSTSEILGSEGWLRTGDLCYIDQDGFVCVVDRLKAIIKYKGYQVSTSVFNFLISNNPMTKQTICTLYRLAVSACLLSW